MNQPHVSQKKKDEVQQLVQFLTQDGIVGLVDMSNMPTLQLQRMRQSLRGAVAIRMSKGRLIKLALEETAKKKQGIEKLLPYIKGMPAVLLSTDNPFTLAKKLKKSKSKAPAKAGQTAPNNIDIKAGPTSFTPGPIIGELGSVGIVAGVEGGKVVIKKDATIVKEGNIISEKVASILTRLGIEPMEIGLRITAVCENGVIFERKILEIDEDAFAANLKAAACDALRLALGVHYPTTETIQLLVTRAYRDATALADARTILTSDNIGKIIIKAERQARGLHSNVGGK